MAHDTESFFLADGRQNSGPFTRNEIERLYAEGQLDGDTLCYPNKKLTYGCQPLGNFFPTFRAPKKEASDAYRQSSPKFFSWKGRLNRAEWIAQWIGVSFLNGFVIFLLVSLGFASEREMQGGARELAGAAIAFSLMGYIVLGIVLASYPTVKRLHDLNCPGWQFLFCIVPILNLIWLFMCLFLRGTSGPNKYGPDPLAPVDEPSVSR